MVNLTQIIGSVYTYSETCVNPTMNKVPIRISTTSTCPAVAASINGVKPETE
jgi:hypothetical protein